MNLIRFFSKTFAKSYIKSMENAGIKDPERHFSVTLFISFVIAIIISTSLFFIFNISSWLSLSLCFVFINLFEYFRISLKASARIKKIETMFPDMVQLMSSNLRAGMTIDKAFLLSARPEFAPLDEEIMKTGREIATGKDIIYAFQNMSKRIDSEKITKTIQLIVSGLKAGGNISTLLEQTASNMREKEFIEKKAASNILMYVIFIFFAVGAGAPVLFGLSSILVEVIISLVGNIPIEQTAQMTMPITFSKIAITPEFIIYFSLFFLIVTDIISSLLIGLVNKGDQKAGLKYILPLILVSIAVFFAIRIFLSEFLKDTFAAVA